MSGNSTRRHSGIKVAAAVDFGTHGTGFAWSAIEPLNDAPDNRQIRYSRFNAASGGVVTHKNLSGVLTNSAGEVAEWGYAARERWIKETEGGRTDRWGYATGYKMALRADTGELGVAQALGSAEVSSLAAVRKLVVGCLAKVRAAAEQDIEASGYRADEIRWCLTVPAIWDEDDKQFMREAAVEAGFPHDDDRLLLAIEPEAAAISGYLRMGMLIDGTGHTEQVPLTKAGARFLVVDCGGGTIDITAYESLKDDEIRLAEIGKVCGGRLGSEFLNHAFRTELLADRLGADVVARLAAEYPAELQRMDDQWESYKVCGEVTGRPAPGGLRLDESAELRVDVPGEVWDLLSEERRRRLIQASGRRYRLVFTAAETQKVFDALIDPILDQIDEQLAAMDRTPAMAGDGGVPYRCMLLVGGFSGCGYLRDRIHHRFGDRIRILRPHNHQSAVLDGAVHYAYDPDMIASRRARHTYGVAMTMPWEPEDGPQRRTMIGGEPKCKDRFDIVVTRGQTVEVDEYAELSFQPLYRKQKQVRLSFYRTMALSPRYVTDTGCEELGSILVPVPRHHRKPGNKHAFTLRMYFGATQIRAEAVDDLTGEVTRGEVEFRRMH